MYKWAVRWMIRRNLQALRRGDPGPLLASYAEDAVLVFPGSSSWGGEHRGKPAIEAFLRTFLKAGIVGDASDIVVNGPPWRTTVCMLFLVHAADAAGQVVYENRADPVRPRRVGKDRLPGGLRRHPQVGRLRQLSGPTPARRQLITPARVPRRGRRRRGPSGRGSGAGRPPGFLRPGAPR